MSIRVDTTGLVPGATVCGVRGLGLSGAVIRATTGLGEHGPGLLYGDVQDGDEAKEFRAFVANPPPGLSLAEDGTFVYTGPPLTLAYTLYVNGVNYGPGSAELSTLDVGQPNLAASTQPGAWSVRGLVSATQTGAWSARNGVAAAQLGAWSVLALVEAVQSGAWSVQTAGAASAAQQGGWSVRGLVAAVQAGAWSVRDVGSLQRTFSSELRTVRVYSDAAGLLGKFGKQPGEVLDYGFDFTPWLQDCSDAIDIPVVHSNVPAELQVLEAWRTDGTVAALVAGGSDGKVYKLTCTVTTAGGRTKEADIQVRIKES